MTATAAAKQNAIQISRADLRAPILFVDGRDRIGIRAGTGITCAGLRQVFETDTMIDIGDLAPGADYGIQLTPDGVPYVSVLGQESPIDDGFIAGFHFAPGGNAVARSGGDATPAINPHSLWDLGFRFAGPDPRAMALVETTGGGRFWADIYLLGTDHLLNGTSRHGATIADGRDLPERADGKGRCKKLDYATAVEIYARHSKRLLGAEEFFAAAYGVEERCSRDNEPTVTGAIDERAERFISKWGLFDATGTMWQWGTDGDPDRPRPSLFGGSWIFGDDAGSRYAYLGYWPEDSHGFLSARGGGDHLQPA